MNDQLLNTMRAGAVRALGLSKSGANSQLYLGLCIHPAHDPEGYILLVSMRAFRHQFTVDIIRPYLERILSRPDARRPPGPLGLWCGRLESLGWQHCSDMHWIDHEGLPVDVCHCAFQELRIRVLDAYQKKVGAKHAARQGFQGLQDVDPWLSNRGCFIVPWRRSG